MCSISWCCRFLCRFSPLRQTELHLKKEESTWHKGKPNDERSTVDVAEFKASRLAGQGDDTVGAYGVKTLELCFPIVRKSSSKSGKIHWMYGLGEGCLSLAILSDLNTSVGVFVVISSLERALSPS
ncbi:unnamed protein product [Nippostrongylus brasiliensis]|uniref:Ovule protein n=1 Tax=Nippostrongylus brasiliensis TaxID=27835 RepID=A0A0N4XNB1_NIPBR|nr:unnamed protein product [Nippostrongylus brasiliensis]